MAKFFQAATDAFNKQEDRIYDKRKRNREDFLAYRKMKAEMGEDVTAEELDKYRRGLAGSDAFFLHDLPSGAMMSSLADRTNMRALNTRREEEAAEVKRQKDEQERWDSFLNFHLDKDVTNGKDKELMRQDWMKSFQDRPELGQSLWDRWSANILEQHSALKTQSAYDFASTTLKDVDDLGQANTIMGAHNLPTWKQNMVGTLIQQRQDSKTAEATAKANQLVVNYSGDKLRGLDDKGLEKIAAEIIAGAEYNMPVNSTEYKALLTAVKASLLERQKQSDYLFVEGNTKEFRTHILSSDSEFIKTVAAKGFDDESVLAAFNMARKRFFLDEVTADSDEFKFWIEAAERAIGNQYEADWNEEQSKLNAKAEAAVEAAKGQVDALAGMSLFEEGGAGYAVMSSLKQGFVLTQDAFQVANALQQRFGTEVVQKGSAEDAAIMKNWLLSNGYAMSEQAFQTKFMRENGTNHIPPGKNLDVYIGEQKEDWTPRLNAFVEEIFTGVAKDENGQPLLPFDATPDKIIGIKQQIINDVEEQLDADLEVAIESRGAFRGLSEAEIKSKHDGLKNTILKQLEEMLQDPKNKGPRPSTINSPAFILQGSTGNLYKAQNGAQSYKDTDGQALVVGEMYRWDADKGTFTKQSAAQLRPMPPLYSGPQSNQRPSPTINNAGWMLGNMQSKNDAVLGFLPDPAIGVRPGGPFDTPRDWISSIIMQMGAQYRAQGQNISDRQLFILLGRPGSSGGIGALNDGDFQG